MDGAGARTSALGAAAVIAGYAVTLTVFATVQWLQYWDYGLSLTRPVQRFRRSVQPGTQCVTVRVLDP